MFKKLSFLLDCNALTYVGFLNKNKLNESNNHFNCLLFKCSNLTNLNCNLLINDQTNNSSNNTINNFDNNNLIAPEGILSIRILNKTTALLSKQNESRVYYINFYTKKN